MATTVHYEVTDTFGGDANYSWVKREQETDVDEQHTSKLAIVRRLKRLMGVTCQRCAVEDYGDQIVVRPVGRDAPCIIGFATFEWD